MQAATTYKFGSVLGMFAFGFWLSREPSSKVASGSEKPSSSGAHPQASPPPKWDKKRVSGGLSPMNEAAGAAIAAALAALAVVEVRLNRRMLKQP
jgi:hypothetical protein